MGRPRRPPCLRAGPIRGTPAVGFTSGRGLALEVRVAHALAPEVALERLAEVARRENLDLQAAPGGRHGTIGKQTPLGPVRGTFRIGEAEVVVEVGQRPAFLPETTVRRLLEEHLTKALSG